MEIAITKMSSKGQIVIPSEMRGNFKEGEKLLLIQDKDQLIIKRMEQFSKTFEEDIIFAKRTETLLKKLESKKDKNYGDFENFVEKLRYAKFQKRTFEILDEYERNPSSAKSFKSKEEFLNYLKKR